MRPALVGARWPFRASRCLRTCVGRAWCPPFQRGVAPESEVEDVCSAAVATDATAVATAEAVTEAVKRPQPDADSAAVEQPDADAVPAGRRRRLIPAERRTRLNVVPPPRPGFAASGRVTAARLERDSQQPTPDAEALFRAQAPSRKAFEHFRVAADAAHDARVRADEAVGPVEHARNTLGFGTSSMELEKYAEDAEDAAVKTADNARAANFAAAAASVWQRTAKDFEHVAHQRAAVAAAAARERLADAGGSRVATDVFETDVRATQARVAAERARELSNLAVNVLNDALAASAAADAQYQRAAAFAADAAADAAAAAAAAEANAANAANEAGDANVDAAGDEIDAAAAAAAADDDDDDDDDLIAAAPVRDADDDDPDAEVRADERRSPEMTIKCSLKTLVNLSGEEKERFLQHLSEIVAVMSKLRVRAFHAVTLFFTRTLRDPRQYDDLFFGSLVHGRNGDKFWREALRDSQERQGTAPQPVIGLLRQVRHDCGGPPLIIPDGVAHIVNSVARELSTAFRNHLSENFFERQLHVHRAFVLRLHVETVGGIVHGTNKQRRKGIDELAHWLSRRVNLKGTDPVDFSRRDQAATRRFDALDVGIQEELRWHVIVERDVLGLMEEDFVSRAWLRSNDPARVIRLLRWTWTVLNDIERFLDNHNLNDLRAELGLRIRVFCLCPQSTIQAAHVPIEAFAFFRLGVNLGFWRNDEEAFTGRSMIKQDLARLKQTLVAQNLPEGEIKTNLRERRAALTRDVKNRRRGPYWSKVFKVKKLRNGRRNLDFAEHVRTDGVSISVMFHRLDYRSVSRMTKNRREAEKTLREAPPDERATQRIIGIDPGRISLCYATEEIVAAAPNDKARRRLFDALAALHGPPALNVGGAGAGGAGADDGGADDGDDGGSDDGRG